MKHLTLAAALLGAAIAAPANAAFIVIDDSDPDFITITAGDFEDGFFVDGVLLTIGLGASASRTLPDGGYNISGSWIDLGLADGGRVDVPFALLSNPTGATSGVEFGATSDGFTATLSGSFGGFDNFVYFTTVLATFTQNGQTIAFDLPFLGGEFISEAPGDVPAPAALALYGFGLAALGLRRRA
jgi:hypothetical protein